MNTAATVATDRRPLMRFGRSRRLDTTDRSRGLTVYQVTDRLHGGRSVHVPGHQVATTVSGWLSELGVHSPLVVDLARAVCAGDWPAAYKIGEHLSVEVSVAA